MRRDSNSVAGCGMGAAFPPPKMDSRDDVRSRLYFDDGLGSDKVLSETCRLCFLRPFEPSSSKLDAEGEALRLEAPRMDGGLLMLFGAPLPPSLNLLVLMSGYESGAGKVSSRRFVVELEVIGRGCIPSRSEGPAWEVL